MCLDDLEEDLERVRAECRTHRRTLLIAGALLCVLILGAVSVRAMVAAGTSGRAVAAAPASIPPALSLDSWVTARLLVCVCVCVCVCVRVCVCVCVCDIHTYIHTYVCEGTPMYLCMYVLAN